MDQDALTKEARALASEIEPLLLAMEGAFIFDQNLDYRPRPYRRVVEKENGRYDFFWFEETHKDQRGITADIEKNIPSLKRVYERKTYIPSRNVALCAAVVRLNGEIFYELEYVRRDSMFKMFRKS